MTLFVWLLLNNTQVYLWLYVHGPHRKYAQLTCVKLYCIAPLLTRTQLMIMYTSPTHPNVPIYLFLLIQYNLLCFDSVYWTLGRENGTRKKWIANALNNFSVFLGYEFQSFPAHRFFPQIFHKFGSAWQHKVFPFHATSVFFVLIRIKLRTLEKKKK